MWEDRKQRNLWAVSSILAPGAMALAGNGWHWVLLGGLGSAVVIWGILFLERKVGCTWTAAAANRKIGKCLLFLSILWSVAAIARALQLTNGVFADGPDERIVALGVLLLALEAGKDGSRAPLRIMAVVGQILLVFMGGFLLISLHTVRPAWCVPTGQSSQAVSAYGILLVPAALLNIPGGTGRMSRWVPAATALMAAAMAAVTAGVLSPQVAAKAPRPLYLAAKSISAGAVMERMEPLVSVILVMGAFATVLGLLCGANEIIQMQKKCKRKQAVLFLLCAGAYGGYFFMEQVPEWSLIVGASIFWGLIPAATLGIEGQKKLQKKGK